MRHNPAVGISSRWIVFLGLAACGAPLPPRGLAKPSRTQVNHCVAEAHDRDPSMAGEVDVDVAIGEEGLIRLATHRTEGNLDAPFLRCVAQAYLDADVSTCTPEEDPVDGAPGQCFARYGAHESMAASIPGQRPIEREVVHDFVVVKARQRPRAIQVGEGCVLPSGQACGLCAVVDADQPWLATDPLVDRTILDRCHHHPSACEGLPTRPSPLFAPCDGGLCCLRGIPEDEVKPVPRRRDSITARR